MVPAHMYLEMQNKDTPDRVESVDQSNNAASISLSNSSQGTSSVE